MDNKQFVWNRPQYNSEDEYVDVKTDTYRGVESAEETLLAQSRLDVDDLTKKDLEDDGAFIVKDEKISNLLKNYYKDGISLSCKVAIHKPKDFVPSVENKKPVWTCESCGAKIYNIEKLVEHVEECKGNNHVESKGGFFDTDCDSYMANMTREQADEMNNIVKSLREKFRQYEK